MPSKAVYSYREIRPFLIGADPSILKGCDFEWPKVKKMKVSPLIEKFREKRKQREYQEMTQGLNKPQTEPMPELKHGLGIGLSFISILFVGVLSGYYLGKYYFGLGELGSLIIGFIVGVVSIYIEVFLYLLQSAPKKKRE